MAPPPLLLALALLAVLAVVAASQLAADGRSTRAVWLRGLASATLRGGVTRSVAVLAIVPALTLTVMTASHRAEDRLRNDRMLIAESAGSAAAQVEAFLARHVTGVRSAAETLSLGGEPDAARIRQWLLKYHPIYPDFLTMLTADASGLIRSGSRYVDGRAQLAPPQGRAVNDREYFRVPMEAGRDYVSNAFRGRGFGTDPLIAIASPVLVDGEPWGVVQGSLNVRAFERLADSYRRLLGASFLLVDAQGLVIYAGAETGYDFLEPVRDRPLGRLLEDPTLVEVTSRDGLTPLVAGHARTATGWHVILLKPKPTFRAMLDDVLAVAGWWLLLVALLAGTLAFGLARRVTRPMERLTRALDAYEVGQRSPFRAIDRLPSEYREVFRHLHGFAVRHANRHRQLAQSLAQEARLREELQQVLDRRELEILDRTRQLAVANQELQRLSRTDALTGLPNRRAFDESHERLWRAAARDGAWLSVILFDVDFFKRYNDRYGHPAGDEVLKRIAAALPLCLNRPADVAARYGGEEFAVVLGDTGLDGAHSVAERIRAAVAELGIEHWDATERLVTISLGVAAVHAQPTADPADVLVRADAALYVAKQQGRNRVALDESPASHPTPRLRLVETR